MKRRLSSPLLPDPKRAKPNEPLPTFSDILNPLYQANKLQGDGNEEDSSVLNAYNAFSGADQGSEDVSVIQRQLGQFMTNQLANGSNPGEFYQPFGKLNVRTHPTQEATENLEENIDKLGYNPNTRTIDINTYDDRREQINPLSALLHEGTHALDDLSVRNSYTNAIPTLAKMEDSPTSRRNLLTGNHDWYTQAQNILNMPSFTKEYPLGSYVDNSPVGYGHERLNENHKSFIKRLIETKKQSTLPIDNFNKVQDNLGDRDDHYYTGEFEEPFTEFTAHVVENLHEPWNINKDSQKEDGRRFLKGITKGAYRGFQKLDPNFSTTYPDADQAFQDRISQMRNYERYPTSEDYMQQRGHTMRPSYKPA